jgi:hypothetical protein
MNNPDSVDLHRSSDKQQLPIVNGYQVEAVIPDMYKHGQDEPSCVIVFHRPVEATPWKCEDWGTAFWKPGNLTWHAGNYDFFIRENAISDALRRAGWRK